MLGSPLVRCFEKIGTISRPHWFSSTAAVFHKLAFQGPGKVPFMISWRKYVDESPDDEGIKLSVDCPDIRFSYLQPDEVLSRTRPHGSTMIVDTQGLAKSCA